jgi:hypothetical protein
MVTFTETELPLSLSQIEEIEMMVGLNFPESYKTHLLKYNGGRCYPNIFFFEEKGNITDSFIDWFLAIYEGKYDNLKTYIEIYKLESKRLPSHILPIAHDPGGNLICISCGNQDNEYIYFWDHENEVNYMIFDDNNYSNMYLIAKSFEEFLDGLKENP